MKERGRESKKRQKVTERYREGKKDETTDMRYEKGKEQSVARTDTEQIHR